MTQTWKKTGTGVYPSLGAEYSYGETWKVRKEWYADGPSLFTWVVYKDGAAVIDQNTLKAAKRLVEKAAS